MSEELFGYVDSFADAMVQRFLLEHDQWITSTSAARAETVRALLSANRSTSVPPPTGWVTRSTGATSG